MTKVKSVRKENTKYDISYPSGIPEIFVDGLDQLIGGFPITKVVFYQVSSPANDNDGIVQREAALRLVMPTAALLEFCQVVLSINSDERIQSTFDSKALNYARRMKTAANFKYSGQEADAEPVSAISTEEKPPVAKKSISKTVKKT